jgi:hypothetical protein
MSDEHIQACLKGGTSVLVGSVSRDGLPSCCRGIAIRMSDDLATATVYVPLATSQDAIADIAVTHRIAVGVSRPIDNISIQIKGTTTAARLADDDEAVFVRRRLDELADRLDAIGLPRETVWRLTCWPAYAIEVHVEEIYEQTPGPRAGSRLR